MASTPSKSNLKPAKEADNPVLEVAGMFIPIKDLPDDIKDLVRLFSKWDGEKQAAIDEVQKCDAAMRSMTLEITKRVTVWQNGVTGKDG